MTSPTAAEQKSNSRAEWVDYAKAIGIILVVYGHVARGVYSAGLDFPTHIFKLADSIVYSFHMPLFFFLSGLFFSHSFSTRGGAGLVLNKVDTIFYPYLVWSILQGSIEALLSHYTNGSITFRDVFSLLWEPRAQFWFLYALFMTFVASTAVYSLLTEKFTTLIFALTALLYIAQPFLPDILLLRMLPDNFVFFAFGIVFTKHALHRHFASAYTLVVMLLIFIAAQYYFHGYLGQVYTDKGAYSLLLALISILFIVSLSTTLSNKPNRLIAYIGTSSMAIYLMHILFGSGTRIVLNKLLGIESVTVHLIAGSLAGVVAPLLALRFINRAKISYLFSAPISRWLADFYNRLLRHSGH